MCIRRPLVGHQAAKELCKWQVTVQVYRYRSPVQCPFQVYGSQSSSYWYQFTSFQVLGTCLIASSTAQEHHFTVTFGWIHLAMALQSGTWLQQNSARDCHLGLFRLPWPTVCPNGTKGIQQVPLMPQGLQNGSQWIPKWSPTASQLT